ncbi:MAG: hypothetical protein JNM81_07425 [Rhodospirillaceae bacterium]|nr:hypothetical protein [Rhodospirillaceae bacterium]
MAKSWKEFRTPNVRFIGEQDGLVEIELKAKLRACLERYSIVAAYLARVAYEDGVIAVALCIRTGTESEIDLVSDVSKIFASIFSSENSLDVIFLTDEQELDLKLVCRPFLTKIAD